MIADNVLRRQLNPMEQARLIKRLKEQYGIKPGPKGEGQGTSNSVTVTEIARVVGVEPETAKQLNRLNKLILPLQELVSAGRLGASNGSELAAMTIAQQQALVDAIGADAVADLKRTTIQAAKKAPDTSALAAHIAALEAERDDLQSQLKRAETAAQEADTASSLLESLKSQLDAAEATRQAYADELARLQAQGPVERIVEKVVEVEKPVPDPVQAEQITLLERQLAAAQTQIQDLLSKKRVLADYEKEKQTLESAVFQLSVRLEEMRGAQDAQQRKIGHSATAIAAMNRVVARITAERPGVEAVLSESVDTIFEEHVYLLAEELARQLHGFATYLEQRMARSHTEEGECIDVAAFSHTR